MKKSCGIDGISNENLKCCSPVIEKHLSLAFNKCIDVGIFSKSFKIAKVISLYKKGNKDDPANYQPISLLSYLSKVLEKIIHKRMLDFSTKFSFLWPAQYGFNILTCVDAIAAVTEYMPSETDKKAQ